METINTISITIGIVVYVVFFGFCVVNWVRGVTGRAILAAVTLSLGWIGLHAAFGASPIAAAIEHITLVAWIVLLARALGLDQRRLFEPRFRPVSFSTLGLFAVGALGILVTLLSGNLFEPQSLVFSHVTLMLLNVMGLVLIEQLVKNTRSEARWRTRYLAIGLGTLFGYGIVLHATATFFISPVAALHVLQPTVLALAAPFVVIASLRNRSNRLRFNVKRNFVFQTSVLFGAGVLILMFGLFGYVAQIFAGDVGTTLAVFASIVGITGMLVAAGSPRTRKRLRVTLAKTFFEYRYDYRDEWIRITDQLTEPDADFDLSQQAQRAVGEILHSDRSALWIQQDNERFVPISQIDAEHWLQPISRDLAKAIITFYQDQDWVLDLTAIPPEADGLREPLKSLPFNHEVHFLIPLFVDRDLLGVIMLGKPAINMQLSWEDFDIIKLVSKQCAGFLALQQANLTLRESDQLLAMNQMSAFFVHDLKTITAQLSLMVENASHHRANPAFIDDMLKTTANSVARMQKILATLKNRTARRHVPSVTVELNSLVIKAVEKIALAGGHLRIAPSRPVHIRADQDQLASAINHLTQNAIEAVDQVGQVDIHVKGNGNWAEIEIKDDGPGMTREYIENELFTPFKSSKGVSGMGIGAYQARVYVRSLGGDITVTSKVGEGSTFHIKLPLVVERQATA